jgi:hypothetical protein
MLVVVKEVRASVGFTSSPNGDLMPSGLGGTELPSLGSSEALPALMGSDMPNLCPRGRASQTLPLGVGEAMVMSSGHPFDFDHWGA